MQCNTYYYQKALAQLAWKIPWDIITIHALNSMTNELLSEVNLINRTLR